MNIKPYLGWVAWGYEEIIRVCQEKCVSNLNITKK